MKDASFNSMNTIHRFKTLLQSANNNLLELLLNAANDEKLRSQCLARNFEGGWNAQWAAESKKSEQPSPVPQNHAPAFFGCAIIVLNNRGYQNAVLKYLELLAAPPYLNFHALKALTNHYIRTFQNEKSSTEKSTDELILKACSYASTAANIHHTPGYILFAQVNFWAAQCLEEHDTSSADAHYECAYKHLLIAQELEPHSAEKIQRASLGQGIRALNQWDYDSIELMISKLVTYLPDSHYFHCKKRAEKEASIVAKEIIEFCYPYHQSDEPRYSLQFN